AGLPRVLGQDAVHFAQHANRPPGDILEVPDGRGDDVERQGLLGGLKGQSQVPPKRVVRVGDVEEHELAHALLHVCLRQGLTTIGFELDAAHGGTEVAAEQQAGTARRVIDRAQPRREVRIAPGLEHGRYRTPHLLLYLRWQVTDLLRVLR